MTILKQHISLPAIGIFATLEQNEDGSAMRPILPGRQIKAIGRYPSEKCGSSYQYESPNELHGFWHAEVDTAVEYYRAQPHTLHIKAECNAVSYTPDREDVLPPFQAHR